ncbi:MAG: HEAT repeat domain-containing protein [Planctomycetota bacterium]|jgi:hypothetical protein
MSEVKGPLMLAAVLLTIAAGVLPIACLGQEANSIDYVELFEKGLKDCYRYRNPYLGVHEAPPELYDPNAIGFLIGVLKNGPQWMPEQEHHLARCYAAVCLGAIGDSRAFQPLVDALEILDENENFDFIAVYAAHGLGLLGDPNAVEVFVKALQDKRVDVRISAIGELGKLRDFRAIEPIIETVKKEEQRDTPQFKKFSMRLELDAALSKMTKVKFQKKYPNKNYQLWFRWFQQGSKFIEPRFNAIYSRWKKMKKETKGEKYVARKEFNKMIDLGIPSIPFMAEKVKRGEIEFIPAISKLTDGKLKKGATQAECLDWWNKNKKKWLIPFGQKLRVGVEKL